ncbi:MAG: RNA-binding protein [Thaumarchaeota archaeon]|nr:RNA-binding protein [Nitrososphaerota archaeon]
MDRVRASLHEVEKVLQNQVDRRERLLKEGRDVISSSSRAIVNLHNRKFSEADKELSSARRLLADLRKVGSGSVERYLISPEAEFVEASVVSALVRGKAAPSRASLGTSPEAYVLGLLDSVGELKRQVLDSIMAGNVRKAKRHFASMEELYSLVSPFAVYDHVVNGARRKIDVARMLVEDTRGVLTEETRRDRLVSSMDRLYKKLE